MVTRTIFTLFAITVVNTLMVHSAGPRSGWVSLCPHVPAISTPNQFFTPTIKDAISLLFPWNRNPPLRNCQTFTPADAQPASRGSLALGTIGQVI